MKEIGNFLGNLGRRRSNPEEELIRERHNAALDEGRALIKKLERELKERGSGGVMVVESDLVINPPRSKAKGVVADGREISLLFDLQMCPRSDINPTGWESKRISVGVLDNSGVTIVGISGKTDHGYSTTVWLDETVEYHKMVLLRGLAVEESHTSQYEFTLEEQARFALPHAQYVTDARHDRSLD